MAVTCASISPVNGVLAHPKRWRAFADAIALALGINVWISIVVLPGFFVGIFRDTNDILLASLPLLALGAGLWRRNETVLLLIFPSALMVPVALAPAVVSSYVYGPIRFVVVAIGLIAYLFGVSFFSSFYEPPEPTNVRPLASSRQPTPPRWRRRFRMYRSLTILSVLFPAVLLYTVNFDKTSEAFLRQMFPGRVDGMTTVLNLGVIVAWVAIFNLFILGVLKHHRTGDRTLIADLNAIRTQAKRGKPRPIFFIGVACALGFMLLLFVGRCT